MTLRVLLAQAELERVPIDVAGHPAVRRHAKHCGRKPTQILLDQNHHAPALSRLPDGRRRGRPDIVHYTLLVLLESPLAKAGGLEAAVHTRNGELVRVRPDTRLPRGEARFQGVLAKVLETGASQEGPDPLVWVETVTDPAGTLQRFAQGPVVRLDDAAPAIPPAELAGRAEDSDLTLVLGAYPEGHWSPAWQEAAPDAAAIWNHPLNAWAVAAECAAAHRARWGPAEAPAGTP